VMRPQWGAFGKAAAALSACFVNPLAIEADIGGRLGLTKMLLPSGPTRKLSKSDMLHNTACPNITVNPQTFEVMIDGKVIGCDPAKVVPLAQRYMLR
jgi:urease subunit alpha